MGMSELVRIFELVFQASVMFHIICPLPDPVTNVEAGIVAFAMATVAFSRIGQSFQSCIWKVRPFCCFEACVFSGTRLELMPIARWRVLHRCIHRGYRGFVRELCLALPS